MSHEDSLDDEVKAILARTGSDDSSESNNPKKEKKYQNDEYNDYEIDNRDPLEDKNMDDREW